MQCFLSSRPKQFSTPQQAVEYMVRSGQVRNVESARVSVIGQIQPMVNIESKEVDAANGASNSAFPEVSHLCETVREEDEEEDGAGESMKNDKQKSFVDSQQSTTANISNETKKFTWRIDLSKTEKFWQGWFSGLQNYFIIYQNIFSLFQ